MARLDHGIQPGGVHQKRAYRADIDGVRAIAVLAVVAFHMRLPMADGGFTGVDIFFVLSGYLITGILLTEHDEHGGVRLGRFWTRRIRRLLPAATTTVVGTLFLTLLFLPATAWKEVARTSVSATLYYANFLFGADAADYFAADIDQNPLVHFWSLAVEEQFYLFWPFVIWGTGRMLKGRRSATEAIVVPIAFITIASFVYSLWLTGQDTAWSYYASPARAWEFGVGGLVAALARSRPSPAALTRVGTWLGLGLIATGFLRIDGGTAFPGTAALWPVVGTALLCYCTPPGSTLAGRLLRLPPAVWIGKISYSLYLWHWPLLVIGARATGNDSAQLRVLMVAISFVLAALSYYVIENPVRHHRVLLTRRNLNYGLAALLIVLGLGASLGLRANAERKLDDPLLAALAAAPDDFEQVEDLGCDTNDIEHLRSTCTFGQVGADTTVLLLGDSHAGQWQTALTSIAEDLDYEVVFRARGGCPAAFVGSTLREFGQVACQALQDGTPALLDELRPDIVVVSHIASYLGFETLKPMGDESQDDAWARGVTSLLDELTARGIGALWIHDQPTLQRDPIDCIALDGIEACNPDRLSVTHSQRRVLEVEEPIVAQYQNVLSFDPTPSICDAERCEIVSDNLVRYRDDNHLTASFVATLEPEIEGLIRQLLQSRSRG